MTIKDYTSHREWQVCIQKLYRKENPFLGRCYSVKNSNWTLEQQYWSPEKMQSFLQASLLWGIRWENEHSHALVEAEEFGKPEGLTAAVGQKRGGSSCNPHRATAAIESYC